MTQELITRYISPNPFRPGVAEARVTEHGVPVWALVGHWEAGDHDIDSVAQDYALPRPAVEAALAYYERHKAAIDVRIAANAA